MSLTACYQGCSGTLPSETPSLKTASAHSIPLRCQKSTSKILKASCRGMLSIDVNAWILHSSMTPSNLTRICSPRLRDSSGQRPSEINTSHAASASRIWQKGRDPSHPAICARGTSGSPYRNSLIISLRFFSIAASPVVVESAFTASCPGRRLRRTALRIRTAEEWPFLSHEKVTAVDE